jgi:hypothetical protein
MGNSKAKIPLTNEQTPTMKDKNEKQSTLRGGLMGGGG